MSGAGLSALSPAVAERPDAIKSRRQVDDCELVEFESGRVAVRFSSDCDCLITIDCVSVSAAHYLISALRLCSIGVCVDVQLDKVL